MDKDLSMSGIAKLTSDLNELHEKLLVQADHWMQVIIMNSSLFFLNDLHEELLMQANGCRYQV